MQPGSVSWKEGGNRFHVSRDGCSRLRGGEVSRLGFSGWGATGGSSPGGPSSSGGMLTLPGGSGEPKRWEDRQRHGVSVGRESLRSIPQSLEMLKCGHSRRKRRYVERDRETER